MIVLVRVLVALIASARVRMGVLVSVGVLVSGLVPLIARARVRMGMFILAVPGPVRMSLAMPVGVTVPMAMSVRVVVARRDATHAPEEEHEAHDDEDQARDEPGADDDQVLDVPGRRRLGRGVDEEIHAPAEQQHASGMRDRGRQSEDDRIADPSLCTDEIGRDHRLAVTRSQRVAGSPGQREKEVDEDRAPAQLVEVADRLFQLNRELAVLFGVTFLPHLVPGGGRSTVMLDRCPEAT